jgi:uncharacterized SAM-binding protein YcdF (DUF218 family)
MFKHVVTLLILPPGLFVLLLAFLGVRLMRRRNAAHGFLVLSIAAALWAVSTGALSDRLMSDLERGLALPPDPKDGAIVLLGGGVFAGAPDLGGVGAPSGEMTARLVTAARLQKRTGLPLIVSAGSPFCGGAPEAPVIRRFLVDLGVPAARITVEDRSRDTRENAEFTRALMARASIRKAVLVTSAFHMRRARFLFEREGIEVVACPSSFRSWPGKTNGWLDWLPTASGLHETTLALKEYMGYGWYRLAMRGPSGGKAI